MATAIARANAPTSHGEGREPGAPNAIPASAASASAKSGIARTDWCSVIVRRGPIGSASTPASPAAQAIASTASASGSRAARQWRTSANSASAGVSAPA